MMLAAYGSRTGVSPKLTATSMIGGNAMAYSDDVLDYEGRPMLPKPDSEGYGLNALYRIYDAAKGWVFVAAAKPKEFAELASIVGRPDLVSDTRFATAEARAAANRMIEWGVAGGVVFGLVVIVLLVLVAVLAALGLAVALGAGDAPNATATLVATKLGRPAQVKALSFASHLAGGLLGGTAVARTITSILDLPANEDAESVNKDAAVLGAVAEASRLRRMADES